MFNLNMSQVVPVFNVSIVPIKVILKASKSTNTIH